MRINILNIRQMANSVDPDRTAPLIGLFLEEQSDLDQQPDLELHCFSEKHFSIRQKQTTFVVIVTLRVNK